MLRALPLHHRTPPVALSLLPAPNEWAAPARRQVGVTLISKSNIPNIWKETLPLSIDQNPQDSNPQISILNPACRYPVKT